MYVTLEERNNDSEQWKITLAWTSQDEKTDDDKEDGKCNISLFECLLLSGWNQILKLDKYSFRETPLNHIMKYM